MLRKVVHSKLHMLRVTKTQPDYSGSLGVDPVILREVGLRVNDAVLVANNRNGERFETYLLDAEAGSGLVGVYGAAAHLVEVGDPLIVMHFAFVDDEEYGLHRPRVAIFNESNEVVKRLEYEPTQL